MPRIRVFLADDHRLLLEAFTKLLEPRFEVVGTAVDGREVLEQAPPLKPDVAVLDVKMPKLNGIDAAARLRKELPRLRIIFLTSSTDPAMGARAMAEGANGYLLKSGAARELIEAIEAAFRGGAYITPELAGPILEATRRGAGDGPILTPRQREVLQLLAQGLTMKEIAAELGISPATVADHKYAMMQALGVGTSAELIRLAVERGLTP